MVVEPLRGRASCEWEVPEGGGGTLVPSPYLLLLGRGDERFYSAVHVCYDALAVSQLQINETDCSWTSTLKTLSYTEIFSL